MPEVYNAIGNWAGDEILPAPPGLLLSLGDGRAVEVSVETMRRALVKFDNDQPMALLEAQVFLDILIQQAQEADRG